MMLRIRGAPRGPPRLQLTNFRVPHRVLARAFHARQPASGSRRHGVNDRAVSWSGNVPRTGRRILGPARSRRGSSTRYCATCAARGAARVGELLPPTGSDTTAGVSRRRSCICRRRRVEACGIPRRRRVTRSTRRARQRGRGGDVVTRAKRVGLCGQTSRSAAGPASSALQCCRDGRGRSAIRYVGALRLEVWSGRSTVR
jgi:hypothetical protein